MQRSLLLFLLALNVTIASAQFQNRFSFPLSDTVTYDDVKWADFDNDSLLDVLVAFKNNDGERFFAIFANQTLSGFTEKVVIPTGLKNSAYTLGDFDSDNTIDIILTGLENEDPSTIVFLNRESFIFEREEIIAETGSLVRTGDIDQDGQHELFLSGIRSGDSFMHIYKKGSNQWALANDSIAIAATSLEIQDFNTDGINDLFIMGTDLHGNPATSGFYNKGGFHFLKGEISQQIIGTSSVSDLNHDGQLDVLLAGKDHGDVARAFVLLNTGEGFSVRDSLPVLNAAHIFTGDLNSDGKADISVLGTNGTDTLNLILYADKSYDTLDASGVIAIAHGDFDRDGDLDLVTLDTTAEGGLNFVENIHPDVNKAPAKPEFPIAAKVFNNIFITWMPATDDHTPRQSLTYDVTVQTESGNAITGTFDPFNGKRLLVNHGNKGTVPYVLLRAEASSFNYRIQAIDNAYHAGSGGICIGSGEGCAEYEQTNLEVCRNENVDLSAREGSLWFSLSHGFLGSMAHLSFATASSDTIFSVSVSGQGACPQIHIYTIALTNTKTTTTTSTDYVCEGSQLTFTAEEGWEQVLWSSTKKGFLSNDNSIVYTISEADTVKLTLSDGSGCLIQRNTALNISKPVLILEDEAYQVLRGESVQLNAQGGGTYFWTPSGGLDNNTISNPVASPLVTTEYNITITDSIGCTAVGKVLVIVEETAFIPNLFTPNDDGRNDELKVYGLGSVTDFSFSIFNREGSLMYSTTNASELLNLGWNGTVKGVKQPTGVYYWKVKGENNVGRALLLNGKNSGSLMLIR